MLDLTLIALLAAGFGFIVWAVDRKHHKYGLLLPACAGAAAALLTWIITVAAGLGYAPGLTWVPWIASLAVGIAASIAIAVVLGRSRTRHDTRQLTALLRR
ncbi:hypothetical protein KIH31_09950 [Paenarthrobacter sp. DKR-5]|uniref:hypothetical protein n=1 Tax=Paenarthrobacter sp. DKR-5 TaxID=2835535 RepID=UPI001BDC9C8B|nr:hypothetical protein [Paenarthrobacter sp. DKR-5]MBT1002929.1 hypothetical protein [Paenarthrobacter sp. DKR-5]